MNDENLQPVRTKKEARERGANGGRKSGESKRKKKLLKECLDALLEMEYEDRNGNTALGAETISVALFKKAQAGNIKAFEVLRDTVGQKPAERVEIGKIDKEQSLQELKDLFDDDE